MIRQKKLLVLLVATDTLNDILIKKEWANAYEKFSVCPLNLVI